MVRILITNFKYKMKNVFIKLWSDFEDAKKVEGACRLYILVRAGIDFNIPTPFTLLLWTELYGPIIHYL